MGLIPADRYQKRGKKKRSIRFFGSVREIQSKNWQRFPYLHDKITQFTIYEETTDFSDSENHKRYLAIMFICMHIRVEMYQKLR